MAGDRDADTRMRGNSRVTVVDSWVSPLLEAERAVQERAKAISLDPAADGGVDRLRSLIQDEVTR